eukprot:Sdes_comp10226_c1_seq1m1849
MTRYFKRKYLGNMELVHVDQYFLKNIQQKVASLRPAHRKLISDIDIDAVNAILEINYITCLASSLNIESAESLIFEFKPKCGMFPVVDYCDAPTVKKLKSIFCRFCMHQYLKIEMKSISSKSNYCPLQMFQRSPIPIIKAIQTLFANPQNNLKIFQNPKFFSSPSKSDSQSPKIPPLDPEQCFHLLFPQSESVSMPSSFGNSVIYLLAA